MIACRDCTYQNPDDVRFCLQCGSDLTLMAASAPAASTQYGGPFAPGGVAAPRAYHAPAAPGAPGPTLDLNAMAAVLQATAKRSLGARPAIVIGLGVAGALLAVLLGELRLRGNEAILWNLLVYGVCIWGVVLLAYIQVRVPETLTATALTTRAVIWFINVVRTRGLGTIVGFLPWDALLATWWLQRRPQCDRRGLVQVSIAGWVGSLLPKILWFALVGNFAFGWSDLLGLAVYIAVGYGVYLLSVSLRWLPAEPGIW